MRITVTTDIFCDQAGCEKFVGVSGTGKDITGARKQARKEGWAKIGEYHFCPKHKPIIKGSK